MSCSGQWSLVTAMVVVDFAFAIANILLKKVLSEGMNHFLIMIYRQSASAIFLAPISYSLERNSKEKLTARVACYLFINALLGATLTQYLFLLGLEHTSATFASAFVNTVPINTFILSLVFRVENLNMKNKSGRFKLLGSLVCVGGVLVLILYQGIPLKILPHSANINVETNQHITKKNWTVGSIMLILANIFWSSWFLIQSKIGKIYPSQYSTTAIMSFFSAIQTAILYLVVDKNAQGLSAWMVKGKLDILTVVYVGTVGSGLCYVVMSWCIKQRGPVFTAAFSPFIQIIVAVFDVFFLREQIHLGSVVGSALVIAGMYTLLWGKSHDAEICIAKQSQAIEKGRERDLESDSNSPRLA